MDKYVHRENLTLFKKRLAEARTDAEREVILKLLADEEAKEPLLKMAFSSRANLHQGAAAQEELELRPDIYF
jgi:hypothetical protein